MSLLIAGYGDLGKTLAQQCTQTPGWDDMPIYALKRQPLAQDTNDHVRWIKADLTNQGDLEQITALSDPISHVVYCAAPNERSQQAYRDTYLTGLQNVVNALKAREQADLPQLLFVSSTAVYDAESTGIVDEQSPTRPTSFNGQILLEAENWLGSSWPRPTVLRLSGIYGPDKQSLLTSIKEGRASMPASHAYWANRIHIEDAACSILHLLTNRLSGVFIGTDSQPMPLHDLYTALADMLNAPKPNEASPSAMMGKKRLSNQKLLATGFELRWPDCLQGYRAIIDGNKP